MKAKTRKSLVTLAGAAVLCVSSLFQVQVQAPLPLPITPHNLIAAVLGMLLGPVSGAGAAGLFCIAGVLAGFFGVELFASDLAGFEALGTLAGGAVAGYFLAAVVSGLCTRNLTPADERPKAVPAIIHGAIAGVLCSSIPVIVAFRNLAGISLIQALRYTFIPYLPAEVVKMLLAVVIADVLRRPVGSWIAADSATS